jgi:hypothetical protein
MEGKDRKVGDEVRRARHDGPWMQRGRVCKWRTYCQGLERKGQRK